MKHPRLPKPLACLTALLLLLAQAGDAQARQPEIPDLTAGGERDPYHDWNLGPTGARGWIWGWKLETIGAKQILITEVDPGSPANGVLEVGDVVLGAGAGAFDTDAREELGRAITLAESPRGRGVLRLTRWRGGETRRVEIRLPVLPAYGELSPYGCPKAAKLIEAGVEHIASKQLRRRIDDQINVLALLATGDERHLPKIRAYVRGYAPEDLKLNFFTRGSGLVSWQWGYTLVMLGEYYLATHDAEVLDAIKAYANTIAKGQSAVGTWGHGMAWPIKNNGAINGRLGGYGALNQAGLVCHLGLVLADRCGVDDPEVAAAIDKANRFFRFYINKGAIPYGDHAPWIKNHDDNGKNSLAAIIFDLQGDAEATQYFSRMTVASYDEREAGHTGNYFSFLWGALGANRAGPRAQAAFLRQQQWFFDSGRDWEGAFPYQGGAGRDGGEHKYGGWDCTGAYLLGYLTPKKKLYITGKGMVVANELAGQALSDTIQAGSGFDQWTSGMDRFRAMDEAQLLGELASWSPTVRDRAAKAVGERKDKALVTRLVAMLESDDVNARLGASKALGAMQQDGADAVPRLIAALEDRDLQVRGEAARALANMRDAAREAIPALLRVAAEADKQDPRQMLQRQLALSLFYRGGVSGGPGLVSRDLSDVDRRQLFEAVKAVLQNPDGRTRGTAESLYRNLSFDELKPILPAIVHAIHDKAPSGVMFADGIRMSGLELLAKNHVREGIPLCIELIEMDRWGSDGRLRSALRSLERYGTHAKQTVPELQEIIDKLKNDRRPQRHQKKIEMIEKSIQKIEQSKNTPELRGLDIG